MLCHAAKWSSCFVWFFTTQNILMDVTRWNCVLAGTDTRQTGVVKIIITVVEKYFLIINRALDHPPEAVDKTPSSIGDLANNGTSECWHYRSQKLWKIHLGYICTWNFWISEKQTKEIVSLLDIYKARRRHVTSQKMPKGQRRKVINVDKTGLHLPTPARMILTFENQPWLRLIDITVT